MSAYDKSLWQVEIESVPNLTKPRFLPGETVWYFDRMSGGFGPDNKMRFVDTICGTCILYVIVKKTGIIYGLSQGYCAKEQDLYPTFEEAYKATYESRNPAKDPSQS